MVCLLHVSLFTGEAIWFGKPHVLGLLHLTQRSVQRQTEAPLSQCSTLWDKRLHPLHHLTILLLSRGEGLSKRPLHLSCETSKYLIKDSSVEALFTLVVTVPLSNRAHHKRVKKSRKGFSLTYCFSALPVLPFRSIAH